MLIEHLMCEHLEYGHLEYWHLDGAVPSIEKRDQWPRVHWSIWDWTPARWKLTSSFEDFDFIYSTKNCHLIDPESILGLFPGCSILAFLLSIRLKV